MKNVLLMGEPMAMLVANTTGPLESVEQFTRMLAGAEVNVCIALQRLGFFPTYITKLGEEPMGRYIYNRLNSEGIGTDNISFDPQYLTGLQFKSKVEEGDPVVAYFRKGSAASHLSVADIEKVDISKIDHVHLTGIPPALSEECRSASFALIEKAKSGNKYITFDPNLRPMLWSSQEQMISVINQLAFQANMVLPGFEEGVLLTGKDTPEAIAEFYLAQGVETVVIKNGSQGAYLCDKTGCKLIPGFTVEKIIDTVGAGDGFASGVISGRLDGLSLEEAVLRGNAIGAIQVTHKGDNEGLPNREQLEAFMKKGGQ